MALPAAVAVVAAAAVTPAQAQGWREVQAWGVAVASEPAVLAGGLGIAWRDRGRTRIGVALAGGATDEGAPAGRAEVTWHFLLDPARRSGVALYGGGGLALAIVEGDVLRPRVQLAMGLDWAPAGSSGAFLEAGVGGGGRLAAGVRFRKRSAPNR